MVSIQRSLANRVLGWIRLLAVPLFVALSFRAAIADWNDVPTGSMQPTILPGERILVNKLAYDLKVPFTPWRLARWADPERGDIVICQSPADGVRLVKRVVGLPGDTVTLRGGRLFIDEKPVTYVPLSPAEVAAAAAGVEPGGVLWREELPGRRHTVMFARGPAVRDFGPVTVPAGSYFVMGDNRDRSADSRTFGFVTREVIAGEVTAVVASVDPDAGWKPRWGRWFSRLR